MNKSSPLCPLPEKCVAVQAAAALQAERMRRALEARAVVAQVAEQKEAGRAAMAGSQVSSANPLPGSPLSTD